MLRAGVDPDLNQAIVEVSSPIADPAEAIRAHLGVPEAMLAIHSDGTGVGLLPWGRVRMTLATNAGEPVDPADYGPPMRLQFSSPVEGLRCERDAVEDPFAGLRCQIGLWTISIAVLSRTIDGVWPTSIANGKIEVLEGETVVLNLKTKTPPPVPWEAVDCFRPPCPSGG